MKPLKPNAWIAWGGLVVATIAAGVAAWQGYETRKHYRLTATPMVLPHVTDDPLEETWGIFLRNVGTGPAKIDYEAVTLDEKLTDMKTIVARMIEEGALSPEANGSYLGLKDGSYLGVGDTKSILKVSPQSVKPSALEDFRDFIHRRIDIHIDACSVYEECQLVSTKEG